MVRRILIALLTIASVCVGGVAAAQVAAECVPRTDLFGGLSAINTDIHLDATGRLRTQVIFVDFPDAVATASDDTNDYLAVFDGAPEWFDEVSGGQIDVELIAEHQWFRMPSDDDTYDYQRGLTFASHSRYISDAVAAADAAVDFSDIDALLIVPVDDADAISFSPTAVANPGDGWIADGTEIRHAVTFGQDMHWWGFKVVNHEYGHMLGLPDLYSYAPIVSEHEAVGGWSLMGLISGHAPNLNIWEQQLLGLLDDADIACIDEPQDLELTLAPLSATSSPLARGIVIPGGPDGVVHVAEYRDGSGVDTAECDVGILVHRIDQNVPGGQRPAQVIDADPGTPPAGCDALDDGAFGVGETFAIAELGVQLTVLELGANARVEVVRGGVVRLEGASRIGTAIAASRQAFPDQRSAGAVVLSRSDGFADALAGTPLAVARNAPILLTPPDRLHESTAAEIARVLAPGGTVHLLGGVAALSVEVEDALTDAGFVVVRLGGDSRYETAVVVAAALGNPDAVLIAPGTGFPDAVTAGAAAARIGGVVLLTRPDTAGAATSTYLREHGNPERTWAIGGGAARANPQAIPVFGADRHATGLAVAATFFPDVTVVGLARSDDFPDALSGGAVVGSSSGPMLLTPRGALNDGVRDLLCETGGSTQVLLFGGTGALSVDVEAAVTDALAGRGCSAA